MWRVVRRIGCGEGKGEEEEMGVVREEVLRGRGGHGEDVLVGMMGGGVKGEEEEEKEEKKGCIGRNKKRKRK